jgi:hypothetical protein
MMCIGWHINPPPLNVAWEHMDDHLDVINLMDESLMTSMKLITSESNHIIYIMAYDNRMCDGHPWI